MELTKILFDVIIHLFDSVKTQLRSNHTME